MDDSVKFLILLAIGAIGVFFAFSMIQPGVLQALGGETSASLSANIHEVVGSSHTQTSDEPAVLYASYDNLRNIFPVRLKDAAGARVTTIRSTNNHQTIFIGTTRGLFVSHDGGLNYKRIYIAGAHASVSEPADLSEATVILDSIPGKTASEAYLSVYNGGEGVLYRTDNNFFTLEKMTNFKKEAAYAMRIVGDNLYLGMSNGQLIRYNIPSKKFETLAAFPKQITNLTYASDGFLYLMLKGGTLYRSTNPYGTFTKIKIPGRKLFSSASVEQFTDEGGYIFIRTADGIYRSGNGGGAFKKYENIPLLENGIDTFGVANGTIYILSGGRLYTSSYAGVEWSVREVTYPIPLWRSYFIGGGKVLLTQ